MTCERFTKFREDMEAKGFPMRRMWERDAWEETEDGTPPPRVSCWLIANTAAQQEKLPHMVIFTHYPEGGWGMWPIAPGGEIADDIKLLTGGES